MMIILVVVALSGCTEKKATGDLNENKSNATIKLKNLKAFQLKIAL
jgi:hypothetical protein